MTAAQVRLLYGRLMRAQVRSPVALANLAISVFFLAVYSGALGGSEAVDRLTGGNFLTFILPVSVLSAAISGSVAGQLLVADLESGYLRRILTLPISRRAVVLAPMLVGATQVVAQAVLVSALGVVLGADSATGIGGWLVVVALALLWGLAFAGYAVATGLLAGSSAAAQTASFAFFPLIFLAPTFLPREELAGWLGTVSAVNPTTYVLEGMRGVLIDGWDPGQLALAFGVVGLLCVLALRWAAGIAARTTAGG